MKQNPQKLKPQKLSLRANPQKLKSAEISVITVIKNIHSRTSNFWVNSFLTLHFSNAYDRTGMKIISPFRIFKIKTSTLF